MDKFIPPWFGKKKGGDDGGGGEGPAPGTPPYEVHADKAAAWFRQAQTAADTRNYEYAITCYLNGIKFDPTSLEVHRNLFEIANMYRSTGGKSAGGRELRDMLGEKRPVDRFAAAELEWVKDALDPGAALKFMDEAATLGLGDVGEWVGGIGLNAAMSAASSASPKTKKAALVDFMERFEALGKFALAVKCGEGALNIDRNDAQLSARVRNLSARATMNQGRYEENVGQEGSFRSSIRDLEGQKALNEDDSLSVTEEAAQRRVERARADYEANPTDANVALKFADMLRKEGSEKNEIEAMKVLHNAYKSHKEYRFKFLADDIKMSINRRRLRAARESATAAADAARLADVEKNEQKVLNDEISIFEERVKAYPTDLSMKFQLGTRLYDAARFHDAIPMLQEAQQDPRTRARAVHMIGLCFLKEGWYDEAVESLRQAVDAYEIKDDETHMVMRYDLMTALENYSRDHKDLAAAEEAGKLASGIAMKQLNFRDIRARRDLLRDLIRQLRGS